MPLLPTSGADIVRQTRSSAQSKVAQGLSRSGPKPNNVSGSIQVRSAIPIGFSFPSIARIIDWIVSTLAGSGGGTSLDDINPLLATFKDPAGIAVDSLGNIYVGDSNNNKIRKIDKTTREVTTFAGSGTGAFLDATGILARFNTPRGVAVDSSGNVYVADSGNHRIRMIDKTTREVTTFAGTGSPGSLDANRLSATFNTPYGLAFDSSGNLLVADSASYKIRIIAISSGFVSTFAGSGGTTSTDNVNAISASFNYPTSLAFDSSGNVYVTDLLSHKIRKISGLSGEVTTLAGTGLAGSTDGNGNVARFNYPQGLAIDSADNIYVADSTSNKIRKITLAGVVSTLAGQATAGSTDATGILAKFNTPRGIAVDSSGNIYVADSSSNKIRKITYA
jgi:sugar lactone lactonase YvrE